MSVPAAQLDVDPPPVAAQFRKRAALLAFLHNFVITYIVAVRDSDIGANASALLTWLVVANCLIVAGIVGAKAVEQVFALRTQK